MILGVAREGSEPSLFYDLRRSEKPGELLSGGWYLDPLLPAVFELEVWERVKDSLKMVAKYIAQTAPDQGDKKMWVHPLVLEVKREVRPDED